MRVRRAPLARARDWRDRLGLFKDRVYCALVLDNCAAFHNNARLRRILRIWYWCGLMGDITQFEATE
jgi:hypothetical protein